MAGSETTSNTLSFAILYMIKYPSIQQKVQQEIDQVTSGRWPSLQDRPRMNYTEAVLMEVQRFVNIVPVSVPHRAMTNTTLLGYNIPKDTTILISLRSLHLDHSHWDNPHIFDPNRFLDTYGNLKRAHDDWFAPFGFGKRRCLGETLAKSSLFLIFTAVLGNFQLKISPEHDLPEPEGYDGITISPRPFYVTLSERNI